MLNFLRPKKVESSTRTALIVRRTKPVHHGGTCRHMAQLDTLKRKSRMLGYGRVQETGSQALEGSQVTGSVNFLQKSIPPQQLKFLYLTSQ
jgi:hypothetical protein